MIKKLAIGDFEIDLEQSSDQRLFVDVGMGSICISIEDKGVRIDTYGWSASLKISNESDATIPITDLIE